MASVSLDLDNEWSYLKTHGDPGWRSLPSYLEDLLPRILDFMSARDLRITFFVVGQDAALDRHRDVLALLGSSPHEVGNHSYRHEPWLHRYSDRELADELARAHDAIAEATGRRPRGFRGPGFSLSGQTLRELAARGYHYDASTLPTFIGPVARWWYFRSSHFDPHERAARERLFGSFGDATRPNRPYRWRLDEGPLVEVPVTTMPLLRVPIHVSYLLYLQHLSPVLARRYFDVALWLCRVTNTQPSLLLHPLDFTSGDEVGSLRFFPGMGLPTPVKLELVSDALARLGRHFDVHPVCDHAAAVPDGRLVEPSRL